MANPSKPAPAANLACRQAGLTVLSLCTGYGGLELGLSRALENPLRVVAVEIEAYAMANLVAKAEEGKLAIEALYPDLRTFPAERFSGCFDFILAGYPCQPFSVAGKRAGAEDPRHLWPHISRIIKAVRPVYGFFENVPGHLTLGFPEVYRSLRNMGYKVEAGLFTAAEVGAPHRRQRLFILAHNASKGLEGEAGPSVSGKGIRLASNSRAASELADAEEQGRQGQESEGSPQAGGRPAEYGGGGQRVPDELRLRTSVQNNQPQHEMPVVQDDTERGSNVSVRWPARPGQPQYEWEEPRVISDTRDSRQRELLQQEQECRGGIKTDARSESQERMEGQTQSGVGRAVNGPRSRVDRLRLLGNGVVPQQAELAFRSFIRHGGLIW